MLGWVIALFLFQMLASTSRRLLFTLCRQTQRLALPSIAAATPALVRHLSITDQTKRRILLKINTALNEGIDAEGMAGDSDTANVACLNNELILSERMVKFPFHYRCLLEQQLAICPDRWVPANEWTDLYNVVGETTKPLFASITMLVCVQLKHVERGRSLLQFCREHHPQLLTSTATTYSAYMTLLSLGFFTVQGKKHAHDYSPYEQELCAIYEQHMKEKSQVGNTARCARVVQVHVNDR